MFYVMKGTVLNFQHLYCQQGNLEFMFYVRELRKIFMIELEWGGRI